MRKQGKRTWMLLLCALLLTMLFSASAFAAEKISVTGQTQSGSNITFTVTAPSGTLYAARYDMDGRMQGVYAGKWSGTAYTVSVPEKTGKLSFFLFDGNYKPQASAVHDLIIAESGSVNGGVYDNVIIASSVGDGNVTLDGVTIRDKLVVQGGGSKSVHLNACEVKTIEVSKDTTDNAETPRIELNDTPVAKIEAVKPVIIEADMASPVKGVEAKSDVTVQGATTTVESVSVPESAVDEVTLAVVGATVKTVEAEKPLTIAATDYAAPIETVTAKDDVTVQGAKVNTVTVPEDVAVKPEIKVETGAAVNTVTANSQVIITVTVQVTVTVTGNAPVEVAVETNAAVNITTEGTTTVEVSTTKTTAVAVQINEQPVPHVHKWDETSRTAATCKTEGSVTYACSGAGECTAQNKTKTETLRKLPHTEVVDPAEPASCETAGKTAGKHCSKCETVLVAQETIPALGHVYGAAAYVWNGSSCTATRTCVIDTKHTVSETKAGEYVKDTDATCTTNEKGHYEVTFENEQFGSAATAANSFEKANTATGHSFASKWTYDETDHWHAATCVHSDEVSDKAAHSWNAGVERDGEMLYTCTVCSAEKTEPISATRVWMAQQLCTLLDIDVSSYSAVLNFTDCGELADAQRQAIHAAVDKGLMSPAGETEFAPNAELLRAQVAQILYRAAGEPSVAGEDSYTDVAESQYYFNAATTLLNYGVLSDEDAFDPNGIAVQKDAAAWLAALKSKLACEHTSCGEWIGLETTHSHTCNDCHLIITGEHIWNEGEVTTEPTGTTAGVRTFICTVCNATKTEEIPATVTEVATLEAFKQALGDAQVGSIRITANIDVETDNIDHTLNITKPVVVAAGKKLTVKAYQGGNATKQILLNDLVIKNGGSLTLETGAVLTTEDHRNRENEMFYRYTGRVYVKNGGKLDVSKGSVTGNSVLYYDYSEENTTPDSDNIVVGETVPGNLSFVVHNEAQLRDAMADDKCTGGIDMEASITLTQDLTVGKYLYISDFVRMTVPEETNLTVPEGKSMQVGGELLVNGGTLSNAGTVYSYGVIDIIGGKLNNAGTGTFEGLFIPDGRGGEECLSLLVLEHSSFANPAGDAAMHTYMDFVDYWKADGTVRTTIAEGTAVNFTSDLRTKVAAAFGYEQTVEAMKDSSYEAFIPCGTATSGVNTVELGGLAVPSGTALVLKESFFDGTGTYLNKFVVSEGTTLTLKPKAGIDCKGGELKLLGELDRQGENWFRVSDDVTLGGKVVRDASELATALAKGGTIYLCELPDCVPGAVEGEYKTLNNLNNWESQYHIDLTEISKDTKLVALGNMIAVFFDKGFTVAERTTLTFNGLNVVAGANSTVNGRVEIGGDAQLIVQGAEGTTLITNNGTIVVQRGGALSIYQPGNKIDNEGAIENFGDLHFDREKGEFTGNEPLEFAALRDLVCEMYHRFDGYPNTVMLDMETKDSQNEEWIADLQLVYEYPDGGSEMFHEEYPDSSDFDAIGAFSWFIKNGIIPAYNKDTSPELHPYDLVTKAEAAALINKLGNKIDGTTGKTYSTLTGDGLICRTENIEQCDENDENRIWYTSELRQAVDELDNELAYLRRAEVTTEAGLMEALNNPIVSEIRINDDITLNGAYYKDGQFVSLTEPEDENAYDDSDSVYFFPAGANRDQWREIIVESGAALTVESGVKLDIQRDVKLRVDYNDNNTPDNDQDDTWGELTVRGMVNVFGELEPDQDDERRITVAEGAWIAYYGDANWFSGELYKVAGQYMNKTVDPKTLESYEKLDGWDGGNLDFTRLVAYGLTPETEDGRSWWDPGQPLHYGAMRNILLNVYKEAYKDATALPDSVAIGDEDWPKDDDCISNGDVEELLNAFAAALPEQEATVFAFELTHMNCEAQEGICNGGWHDLVNGEHDNTVRNLHFKEAVTVSCGTTQFEGDGCWGGEIRFVNCTFDQDVTVIYNPGCEFRVQFEKGCEFGNNAKVNVVAAKDAPATGLLADRCVEVKLNCTGGKVVSSARTSVKSDNSGSFVFNGVTVAGSNGNKGEFSARMLFNCEAQHSDDFNWDANDHSKCGEANIHREYQFTADGTASVAVRGSTAENRPIRLAGTVDISALNAAEDQEITLHNWCDNQNNVTIGSKHVTVIDGCENIIIGTGAVDCVNADASIDYNGFALQPHVFGSDKDGLYVGNLENVTAAPTYTLERWMYDKEQGEDVLQSVSFTVEYFDEADNCFNGKEPGFNIANMVKVHLCPGEGYDFGDHEGLVLTVSYGGGSVSYHGVQWKPIQVGEFMDVLNEALDVKYAFGDIDENWKEFDYLTFGMAKKALTYAWQDIKNVSTAPDFSLIIDDSNYWNELENWKKSTDEHKADWNPDNWTRSWDDARNMLDRFTMLLSGAVMVHNTDELANALAAGGDICLLPFDDAEGENEDRVLILEDKLTIGEDTCLKSMGAEPIYCGGGLEVSSGKTLRLEEGVSLVLAADSATEGALEICKDAYVMLRTPDEAADDKMTKLTVAENGKLIIGDGGGFGKANNEKPIKLINNGRIEWIGDFDIDLDRGKGEFEGNEPVRPRSTVENAVIYQLKRDKAEDESGELYEFETVGGQGQDNTIRNLHFTKAVTVECVTDPEVFDKNEEGDTDTWGGEIKFENCQFDAGVTVNYNDRFQYRVDFTDSCSFGKADAANTVNVAKGEQAKLFQDVRVELRNLPEGTAVSASAPADVYSESAYTLNGLPLVGGAAVDFDCNANHGEEDDEEVDHAGCSEENYCLRVDVFENGRVTINDEVDVSDSIPRLNNAGTITINGSLTANEVNNQCYWDDYKNEEEGRSAHLVVGSITIKEDGTLTVTQLNNEECWEGEDEAAHKVKEASFINNGTLVMNVNDADALGRAIELGANVINFTGGTLELPADQDFMIPAFCSLTVINATVNGYLQVAGGLTVTDALSVGKSGIVEVYSIGSLHCTKEPTISGGGQIIQTTSYKNALIYSSILHQSNLVNVTATKTYISLVLTQTVEINKNTEVDFLVIGENASLQFENGATLTVKQAITDAEGKLFEGNISGAAITDGENDAKILSAVTTQ